MSLGGLMGGGGAGGIGGLLGGLFGGPIGAMIGQLAQQILSKVVEQVIEDVAKQTGMPDFMKDAMQATVAGAMGDQEGVKKNVKELLGDFQKMTGASDSDMGHVDRTINEGKEKIRDMMMKMIQDNESVGEGKTKGGKEASLKRGGGANNAGGAGGADNAGGSGGAGGANNAGGAGDVGGGGSVTGLESGSFFMALAVALAQGLQGKADKLKAASDKMVNMSKAEGAVGKDDEKGKSDAAGKTMQAQTELNAASKEFEQMANCVKDVIASIGSALKTVSQPG